MVSTETHAVFAQRGAGGLLETFDLVGDLLTLEHAERFRELERHAARYSCYVFRGREPEQRLQESFDVRLEPQIEPRLHRIAWRARETLIGDDAHARFERLLRGDKLADRLPHPPHGAIGREHDLAVGRVCEACRPRVDFARQRLLCGAGERLRFRARRRSGGRKHESVQSADDVTLDHDLAALADVGLERCVLAQPTHQHAGAPIDEALGEPLVQRVGQFVFDRARDALPVLGINQPVGTVRRKSPGPDVGDAVRQRVDVTVVAVCLFDLACEPVVRDRSFPHQETVERGGELGMGRWRDFAIIGHLADIPQPLDCLARRREQADLVVARRMFQNQDVLGDGRAGEAVLFRRLGERGLQCADRCEVKLGIAPLQHLDRLERMAFERLRQLGFERRAPAGGAEGAVANGAAGAAGDLRQFSRIEPSELVPVEFAVGGESDVIDVEVEPHPDGVGGNQILDVAGLIERNLRVARARTERPQHHGSAATLATDQLGNRIDFLGRERDDRGAARKSGDFLLARK